MELTWDTFKENLQEFHQTSSEINDGWILCNDKKFHTEYSMYLYKRLRKPSIVNGAMLVYEYHITFDGLYCVPKLCLNVFRIDGSQLLFDEIIAELNFSTHENVLEIFTQMDHPVLQQPFYCLHPCKTADLMKLVAFNSRNVLVSWLSTVGPSIGLHLSNDYSQLTKSE